MNIHHLVAGSLLAAATLFSASAQAGVVNCPLDGSGTRQFQLTTTVDSVCLASGDGNLQGEVNQADAFTSSAAGAGYAVLDKDPGDALAGIEGLFSVTGLGAASGTFTIDISLWSLYDSLAIGFKVGNNLTPDWAVFGLASGTLTGSWANAPQQGAGLSHANIYGIKKTNTVPEPISLVLLGAGLLGIAVTRRNRKAINS